MELLQLKYFQYVARLENITHAAEKLHISQPSLSKVIARLEKDLGTPLFERRKKRLKLNEYGKIFLQRVDRCFYELEEGQREINDLIQSENHKVVVAATSSRLLPNILTKYLSQNPHGQFHLLQITEQEKIKQALLQRKIDLCLSFFPLNDNSIHCQKILTEDIFLAVAPQHRLASEKSVNLSDIATETLISLTSECGLREITSDLCRKVGFTPNIAFEINSLEVISSLVNANLGVAFIPANNNLNNPPVLLPIKNPPCRRAIYLCWLKYRSMTPAVHHFKDFLLNYFITD